jgi:hypothetical protein
VDRRKKEGKESTRRLHGLLDKKRFWRLNKLAAPSAARPASGEARVLDSKSFSKHRVIDKINLGTIECRLYVLF